MKEVANMANQTTTPADTETTTERTRRQPVSTTVTAETYELLDGMSFDLAKELRVRSVGSLVRVAIGELLVSRGIISADAAKTI